MTTATYEINSEFYQLAQEVLGAQRKRENREGRAHPRQPFPCVQRIAPSAGDEIPDASFFIPVRCHDLSPAGFSFFLPAEPEFKTLIVAFGAPPEVVYAGAEVLHCTPTPMTMSHGLWGVPEMAESEPLVLVGCKLTYRFRRTSDNGPLTRMRPL
ncbi:MAG: hypothetical protein JW818_10970 [Pirellulales bacterium]|nr:hypothetical protein [Pirellulales bacterium]